MNPQTPPSAPNPSNPPSLLQAAPGYPVRSQPPPLALPGAHPAVHVLHHADAGQIVNIIMQDAAPIVAVGPVIDVAQKDVAAEVVDQNVPPANLGPQNAPPANDEAGSSSTTHAGTQNVPFADADAADD